MIWMKKKRKKSQRKKHQQKQLLKRRCHQKSQHSKSHQPKRRKNNSVIKSTVKRHRCLTFMPLFVYGKIMKLKECTKCRLHKTRTQVVVGVGSKKAKYLFIGEAPGKNEDEQGIPFVGRAGKVLRDAISKSSIKPKEIYITNIVKCRPPKNRDPIDAEKFECSSWLIKQINIIQPKIIITLGRHAFDGIRIISDTSVIVDNTHSGLYEGRIDGVKYPIWRIYHPAVCLYNPSLKGKFYEQIELTEGRMEWYVQNKG